MAPRASATDWLVWTWYCSLDSINWTIRQTALSSTTKTLLPLDLGGRADCSGGAVEANLSRRYGQNCLHAPHYHKYWNYYTYFAVLNYGSRYVKLASWPQVVRHWWYSCSRLPWSNVPHKGAPADPMVATMLNLDVPRRQRDLRVRATGISLDSFLPPCKDRQHANSPQYPHSPWAV